MSIPPQTAGGAVSLDVEISYLHMTLALACGFWYIFVIAVQSIGIIQIYRHYSFATKIAVSPTLDIADVPPVTILRPIKGNEPYLYECLASSFQQNYPREKLTIYLCVATADDPSIPILHKLLTNFAGYNTKIFIEEEDPALDLHNPEHLKLGLNPKIRNLSRGYREAKSDIIWILDSNIWVAEGVIGRMVDKLCGFTSSGTLKVPYKLVHQLPLVTDSLKLDMNPKTSSTSYGVENSEVNEDSNPADGSPSISGMKTAFQINLQTFGGLLEQMYMSSTHAKFYTAINTVSLAPCLVGKSNMFRKSHLDYLTRGRSNLKGLDYFSEYICEDHVIGDTLWKKKVPEENSGQKFNKHGLVFGDLAIQPMTEMTVLEYISRRVRWLRARKWTVLLATLVEPGVESLLCSSYGAFAIISLPWFHNFFGLPQTWIGFLSVWLLSVCMWMSLDALIFAKLHSGVTIRPNLHIPSLTPPLALANQSRRHCRSTYIWIVTWLGRELLALPIWIWACLCGATVEWRGIQFRVNLNMVITEKLPHKQQHYDTIMPTANIVNKKEAYRQKCRQD